MSQKNTQTFKLRQVVGNIGHFHPLDTCTNKETFIKTCLTLSPYENKSRLESPKCVES